MVVFALTTSNRPILFTGQINTNLFSGYVSAWNNWSLAEFQLIIFNVIMFMPLGLILPFIHSKLKTFWRVLVVSFAFTAGIEIFQLVTGKGIFELDDLFHNTLGSIAGYFIVMVLILSIEKKKIQWLAIGKAFAIPLLFVGIVGIGYIAYQAQEYGNLAYKPAQKQSMENVDVQLESKLSDETYDACIYYNNQINNLESAKDFSEMIAKQFQLTQQGGMRIEGENRRFQFSNQEGENFSLVYFMHNGGWSLYKDNSEESPQVDIESQKQLLEDWFIEKSLMPANAIFHHQYDSTIRWGIPVTDQPASHCEDFSQGFLIVTLSNNEIPNNIMYDIQHNKFVGEEKIISEQQAFEKLQNGEFNLFNPLVKGDTLTITDVQLTYTYDTKGYYRPAYNFTGYVNDPEDNREITISAMEK